MTRDEAIQAFNWQLNREIRLRLNAACPQPAELALGPTVNDVESYLFYLTVWKRKLSENRKRIRKEVFADYAPVIREQLGFERCTDATGWRYVGK